jgi:hypothetical protein
MLIESLIFHIRDSAKEGTAEFLRVSAAYVVPTSGSLLKLQKDMLAPVGQIDLNAHRCSVCCVVEFIPHGTIDLRVVLRCAQPVPGIRQVLPVSLRNKAFNNRSIPADWRELSYRDSICEVVWLGHRRIFQRRCDEHLGHGDQGIDLRVTSPLWRGTSTAWCWKKQR